MLGLMLETFVAERVSTLKPMHRIYLLHEICHSKYALKKIHVLKRRGRSRLVWIVAGCAIFSNRLACRLQGFSAGFYCILEIQNGPT